MRVDIVGDLMEVLRSRVVWAGSFNAQAEQHEGCYQGDASKMDRPTNDPFHRDRQQNEKCRRDDDEVAGRDHRLPGQRQRENTNRRQKKESPQQESPPARMSTEAS